MNRIFVAALKEEIQKLSESTLKLFFLKEIVSLFLYQKVLHMVLVVLAKKIL
jgi:hypothetical protein